MSFHDSFNRLMEDEGGYVNDLDDPGGETKYGISKRSYPDLDIAELTLSDAKLIYWEDWWQKHSYGDLPEPIGDKVFNLSVNMGAHRGHCLLQQALASVGEPVKVDGRLGPITRLAVDSAPPYALLAALRSEAAGHYRVLVVASPRRAKFLRGWLARAYS